MIKKIEKKTQILRVSLFCFFTTELIGAIKNCIKNLVIQIIIGQHEIKIEISERKGGGYIVLSKLTLTQL